MTRVCSKCGTPASSVRRRYCHKCYRRLPIEGSRA